MKEQIQDAFRSIHADDAMINAALTAVKQECNKTKKKHNLTLCYSIVVLCAVFLFFAGMGGYTAYATPVSYIGIEINPSIELALNRFDRVVEAEALNVDGEAVLQNLQLKNRYYTEAINILMNSNEVQNYLKQGEEPTFTVASDREQELMIGIKSCNGGKYGSCQSLPTEIIKEAKNHNLSLGKFRMYQQIVEYDSNFSTEECRNMTMRQLRELYEQLSIEDILHGKCYQ